MFTYSFEKLDVWQKARMLNIEIYQLTKSFPKEETYGLVQQIRRASVSITSNLAEGTSRDSFKEKARFSNIAFSSLMEVLSQLLLAQDLKYIDKNQYQTLRPLIEEIGNKLNGLKKYQLKQSKPVV